MRGANVSRESYQVRSNLAVSVLNTETVFSSSESVILIELYTSGRIHSRRTRAIVSKRGVQKVQIQRDNMQQWACRWNPVQTQRWNERTRSSSQFPRRLGLDYFCHLPLFECSEGEALAIFITGFRGRPRRSPRRRSQWQYSSTLGRQGGPSPGVHASGVIVRSVPSWLPEGTTRQTNSPSAISRVISSSAVTSSPRFVTLLGVTLLLCYSLSAPEVSPLTIRFWATTTRIATGITPMTLAAAMRL